MTTAGSSNDHSESSTLLPTRTSSGGRAEFDQTRLLTVTAVGEHGSAEARRLHLSSHDGLTGLVNRTSFVGSVTRMLDANTDLAGMLFIDLDHFKVVNDHLGHRYGDDVLRAASKRIQSAIRSTDVAGRLGGDEIGVFCPDVASPGDLFSLAERLGEALATPFRIEAQIVIIDASIGVSFRSDSCQTAEALIESADRAMYFAKAAGGGRWATLDADDMPTTAAVPLLDRLPHLEADADLMLGAARAHIDRAEECAMLAWQRSTRLQDAGRSKRLLTTRAALRRASLLLRAHADEQVSTTISEATIDSRSHQLQSVLDGGQAIAQAVGMIAQYTGAHATESEELLRGYAEARGLTVASAARMVAESAVGIDAVALVGRSTDGEYAVRPLHEIYKEHSAAVFGSAVFIGGCDASKVTEDAFVQFWQQQKIAPCDPATERAHLLTIALRLATQTAVSTARLSNGMQSPLDSIDAVLRRGQALERTLACVQLSSVERQVAAMLVYGRCSFSEVARNLGEPEDDLNRQLKTVLSHLRNAVTANQ